ncbi:MAG: hypothetical protein ACOZQL_02975 [Myxococcota bacterium]
MTPQLVLPEALSAWAEAPWLRATASGRAWVQIGARRTPIEVVTSPPWLGKLPPSKGLTLFVVRGSTGAQRAALEQKAISYVDPGGYLHVVAPSILVHLERRAPRDIGTADAPVRLGPAAMRVAIAALLGPEDLSIASLAKRAAASFAQTHQTLALLERAGFVLRTGRGPRTARTLTNRSGVAELLRQTVLRQRRMPSTPVFVYARRPEELWLKVTTALGDRAILSGAAAAAVLSNATSGATSVPRTLVRISADLSIQQAVRLLDAQPAESGANVLLMSDKARWGAVLPQEVRHIRIANAVSTWLDCLREPRGEDIAEQFRETTLGF